MLSIEAARKRLLVSTRLLSIALFANSFFGVFFRFFFGWEETARPRRSSRRGRVFVWQESVRRTVPLTYSSESAMKNSLSRCVSRTRIGLI